MPIIDAAAKIEKPFFAVVWFHTPHLPVLTGEQHKKLYNGQSGDTQNFYGSISAMDIAGFPIPSQPEPIDGISILPFLEGRMKERPVPIGF